MKKMLLVLGVAQGAWASFMTERSGDFVHWFEISGYSIQSDKSYSDFNKDSTIKIPFINDALGFGGSFGITSSNCLSYYCFKIGNSISFDYKVHPLDRNQIYDYYSKRISYAEVKKENVYGLSLKNYITKMNLFNIRMSVYGFELQPFGIGLGWIHESPYSYGISISGEDPEVNIPASNNFYMDFQFAARLNLHRYIHVPLSLNAQWNKSSYRPDRYPFGQIVGLSSQYGISYFF